MKTPVKVLFDPDAETILVTRGPECSVVKWPDGRSQTLNNNQLEFVEDDLEIPTFLKRKKGDRSVALGGPTKTDWAPIRKTVRRSDVLEKMYALSTDPKKPVTVELRDGETSTTQTFKNMDRFLDGFYNERVHKYLGLVNNEKGTTVMIDVSAETKMKQRFEDLKQRRNPAPSTGEVDMAAKKKSAKKVVKKDKPAKPEKKLISDPRYDGKKLTRVLQKDLPEGTKPLQKTSPHWGAYIYIARKPGVKFEDYANVAKHSIATLTVLVDAGHVIAK